MQFSTHISTHISGATKCSSLHTSHHAPAYPAYQGLGLGLGTNSHELRDSEVRTYVRRYL